MPGATPAPVALDASDLATYSRHVTEPAVSHAQKPRILLGIALRVGAMAFLACLSALVKWTGSRGIPVFEIILFRNLFAFIPLGLYIWRTTGFEVLKTRRPLGHLTRSVVGLTGMVCGFSAVQHLPLTEATALQFTSPLFMTALSALLLREAVGRHRWAAVVVGFIGVLIMANPIPGHLNVPGVTLGILSALGAAGAMVAIRQIADTERGPTIVFYFTVGGVVLGLAGSAFHWVTPDPLTMAMLVLAGLVGGVGQLLLTEALRNAPVGVIAPFDYTQLVWAAGLGLVIWGELPHPLTLVGAVIVAGSGVYILHRELRRFRAVEN
ncbi:DMT family transporter [Phenylobacterium sp.]|jgi:drug/metabolite transporter (DMT)-like permease|uniref:DMT family transporter n=1 Tax=Phenylobacterium sp. TaxID=1871053 RepID=UPI0037C97800